MQKHQMDIQYYLLRYFTRDNAERFKCGHGQATPKLYTKGTANTVKRKHPEMNYEVFPVVIHPVE